MRSLTLVVILLVGCRDSGKETGSQDTDDSVDTQSDTQQDTQVEAVDADGDGFPEDGDCDDADAEVNPGALEICDGLDNDCDGLVDDQDDPVGGRAAWYQDLDADGYGNPAVELVRCDAPTGFVEDNTDCEDLNADFHPGAEESDCTDPQDYNCDGSVGFADVDGDGFAACEDCDDTQATSSPLGIEVCDGSDNNCDGAIDEAEAVDAGTWYADTDGDGYGDAASTVEACDAPSGHVADDTDCDDGVAATNPAGVETCDGIDNDCDGLLDDADPDVTGTTVFYADADGDGHGGQQFQQSACSAPTGYVTNSDDCDDLDAASYPGAAETCDGADNDCDTTVDEGVGTTWYQDNDGDGYGNGSMSQESCDMPTGYVANSLDCDDFSATTNPASFEVCDGVDNDCDGSTDEDAINAGTWYLDGDNDGYGSLSGTTTSCNAPSGYSSNAADCDDTDGATNPGASEICDSQDNDCDGGIDEGVTQTFYADSDGDGYGNAANSTTSCALPSGYVTDATDCNDAEAAANPGAAEVCDGLDNDCDGTVDGAGYLGSGSQCAAGNCKEILDSQPASADGTYWLDPTGSDPIEIYCDMTNDGGGWTLIGKLAGGNYSSTSDADFIDLIANPVAHVNPSHLQSAGLPSSGQIAFLDRDTTNALYHSGFGVVRVELSIQGNTAANGVYFQQKTNASSSWDLWHAIRDSTQWGSGTSSHFVSGFGSDFVLGKGSSSHNPTTGAVTHQGDGSYGFWDHVTITLGNGESLSVSRHFGLVCDGHGNQGDQWMATGNPADSRWKNDTSRYSEIWLR